MTDTSPGPGWWLASDGKWYPPHLHPAARAAAARPPAAHVAPDESRDTGDVTISRTTVATAVRSGVVAARPTTPAASSAIDWEAVSRERAELRAARNRREADRRRMTTLGVIGALAIAAIVIAALVTRDDDSTSIATTTTAGTFTSTTVAASSTSPGASVTTRTPATTSAPAASGTVSVFSLQPGSCIDQGNLTTGLVTTVRTVPCTQPHSHEVYLRTTVTPIDAAYDATRVSEFANNACTNGFMDYVGIPYEKSKYYFVHLAPSAESWNKSHDRDVVCLVLLEGQMLTSSVKGKGE